MEKGTLAYTHLHPLQDAVDGTTAGPQVRFSAQVGANGTYRAFFQFQVDGTVHTAELTLDLME